MPIVREGCIALAQPEGCHRRVRRAGGEKRLTVAQVCGVDELHVDSGLTDGEVSQGTKQRQRVRAVSIGLEYVGDSCDIERVAIGLHHDRLITLDGGVLGVLTERRPRPFDEAGALFMGLVEERQV